MYFNGNAVATCKFVNLKAINCGFYALIESWGINSAENKQYVKTLWMYQRKGINGKYYAYSIV